MDFAAGFLFGFGTCAIFAAACLTAERLRVTHWLTTDSEDVEVHEQSDGSTISVVRVQ